MLTFIVFSSRNRALRAERLLNQRGIPAQNSPTPRGTGSPCDLSLRIASTHASRAWSVLTAENLAQGVRGMFAQAQDGWQRLRF